MPDARMPAPWNLGELAREFDKRAEAAGYFTVHATGSGHEDEYRAAWATWREAARMVRELEGRMG